MKKKFLGEITKACIIAAGVVSGLEMIGDIYAYQELESVDPTPNAVITEVKPPIYSTTYPIISTGIYNYVKTTTTTTACTTSVTTEAIEEEEYYEEDYYEYNEYDYSEDVDYDDNETYYEESNYENSDYDYILLCNIVGHEYGQDYISTEEKAKVVATVMNRVRSDEWPDTIEGVLSQDGQFENFYCSDEYSYQVTDDVKAAVDYYFENQDEFGDYIYFEGDGEYNYFYD